MLQKYVKHCFVKYFFPLNAIESYNPHILKEGFLFIEQSLAFIVYRK